MKYHILLILVLLQTTSLNFFASAQGTLTWGACFETQTCPIPALSFTSGQTAGTPGGTLGLTYLDALMTGDANVVIQYAVHQFGDTANSFQHINPDGTGTIWFSYPQVDGTGVKIDVVKFQLTGTNAGSYCLYYTCWENIDPVASDPSRTNLQSGNCGTPNSQGSGGTDHWIVALSVTVTAHPETGDCPASPLLGGTGPSCPVPTTEQLALLSSMSYQAWAEGGKTAVRGIKTQLGNAGDWVFDLTNNNKLLGLEFFYDYVTLASLGLNIEVYYCTQVDAAQAVCTSPPPAGGFVPAYTAPTLVKGTLIQNIWIQLTGDCADQYTITYQCATSDVPSGFAEVTSGYCSPDPVGHPLTNFRVSIAYTPTP